MRRLALVVTVALLLGTQANAASVIGQIASGPGPDGIAVDTSRGLAWVANAGGTGSIAVIDTATDVVVDTLFVGGAPGQVAVDAVRGHVFVADFNNANVIVIDESTHVVIARLSPGGLGLAIDAGRGLLYSTARVTLTVFDLNTLASVQTVPANGMAWWGVAIDAAHVYIEDLNSDANGKGGVAVLDATTYALVTRVPVDPEARLGITTDPAHGVVYVPRYASSGAVQVIDATSLVVVSSAAVGAFPFAMLLDGDRLYVANLGSGTVSVLASGSPLSPVETVTLGGGPSGVALVTATKLYVTDNTGGRTVIVAPTPRNSAPVASVTLSTHSPSTKATLLATVTASDPDGDAITLTYVWTVNGAVRQITTTSSTTDTFDLKRPGNGNPGDTVTVQVTPSDGQLSGAPASDSATVRGGK
jgi:YVTN family beta-propeller protein